MDRSPGRHATVYRTLLVLYPAQFRREFGPTMMADFAQRLHDERQHGPGSGWRTWRATVRDLFMSAPEQRWEELVARATAAVAVYSLIAYAVISVLTRTLTFTWLIVSLLAVAGIRWSGSAPDPATGRARMRTSAWLTLGVAGATMPFIWWSGIPEALALIGLALLAFARDHRQPAAS